MINYSKYKIIGIKTNKNDAIKEIKLQFNCASKEALDFYRNFVGTDEWVENSYYVDRTIFDVEFFDDGEPSSRYYAVFTEPEEKEVYDWFESQSEENKIMIQKYCDLTGTKPAFA